MNKLLYQVKTINEEQLTMQLELLEERGTFSLWRKGISQCTMVVSMSRRHSVCRSGGTEVGRK